MLSTAFKLKNTNKQSKRMEKIYYANSNHKKLEMAIQISD